MQGKHSKGCIIVRVVSHLEQGRTVLFPYLDNNKLGKLSRPSSHLQHTQNRNFIVLYLSLTVRKVTKLVMSSGMSSEKAQPKNVTRHKITHPCKIYPFPLTRDGTSFLEAISYISVALGIDVKQPTYLGLCIRRTPDLSVNIRVKKVRLISSREITVYIYIHI